MADRTPTDSAPRGADARKAREWHWECPVHGQRGAPCCWEAKQIVHATASPVPAEATSGALHDALTHAVKLLDEAEDELGEGAGGHEILGAELGMLRIRLEGLLRTPPAPLPREGATVTERMVSHALIGAREEAMRRGVGMHLVAAERLTAALMSAAQPTTKETR